MFKHNIVFGVKVFSNGDLKFFQLFKEMYKEHKNVHFYILNLMFWKKAIDVVDRQKMVNFWSKII